MSERVEWRTVIEDRERLSLEWRHPQFYYHLLQWEPLLDDEDIKEIDRQVRLWHKHRFHPPGS